MAQVMFKVRCTFGATAVNLIIRTAKTPREALLKAQHIPIGKGARSWEVQDLEGRKLLRQEQVAYTPFELLRARQDRMVQKRGML